MNKLISRNEAHKYLNISRVYLDILVARKEIPVVRIGRRVLFEEEGLQKFIQRCRDART